MFRGGKIAGTAGWFDSMGMKPNGKVHAYVAACNEMGCGVLILVGLLTPLAAAGVIGTMVVAGWTVHRHAFFIVKEGWEIVMVMGVLFWAIGALGPGQWSLDSALGLYDDGAYLDNGWPARRSLRSWASAPVWRHSVACYRPPAKGSR